jgi:hypothetical protein
MRVKSGTPGQKQIGVLASQLIERLKRQGYEVEQNVTLEGKSGTDHTFDIVARQNDGFITYDGSISLIVVISFISDADDPEISLKNIYTFEDECYDCGINYKVLIALPWLSPVTNEFAQGQHIKVFDKKTLKAFLDSPPSTMQIKGNIPTKFQAKSEVAEALRLLGYQVKENARVTGKSGAEYYFDILASLDDGFITITLGIDHLTTSAGLNQFSIFKAKCDDADVYEKILLISVKPTPVARQFAENHEIKLTALNKPDQLTVTIGDARQQRQVSTLRSVIDQLMETTPGIKPVVEEPPTPEVTEPSEESSVVEAVIEQPPPEPEEIEPVVEELPTITSITPAQGNQDKTLDR